MLSNYPIDGTCFKMTVYNTANPYNFDETGQTDEFIKFGEDIEELLDWYRSQEFNYAERIEIVDYSK